MNRKTISLSLNEETDKILDDFRWDLRSTKSNIIKKVLYFFNRHPEKLRKILNEKLKNGDMQIE